MHESVGLSHPAMAVGLVAASLLACALVMPTRFTPRRTLVAAAILMGAGLMAATGMAWWNGHGVVPRTDVLSHASLAAVVLVSFATTPAMGGKWCGSGVGVIVGALIMAIAMIVSEVL